VGWLATKSERDLALENGEHLFEIVTVRRRTAAGRDKHIDRAVHGLSTFDVCVRIPQATEATSNIGEVGDIMFSGC
jgi:hypothetical protein